jgi:spore coat protein H
MLAFALMLAAAVALAPVGGAGAGAPELFGLARVVEVELSLTPEAWAKMQPPEMTPFGPRGRAAPWGRPGAGLRPGGAAAAGEPREGHRNGMGVEFPVVRATVKLDGATYADTALRYKGNFTFMASAAGLKRPFRIDLDRFVKGRTAAGVSTFSLNNNIADPSRVREVLAHDLFREAKVPAPRTASARVYLTVPGRYDRRYLGVYTLVEAVDRPFLKSRLGRDDGLLLKPEFQGLPYLGEQWAAYAARFGDAIKGAAPAASTARYIALARLVNEGGDEAFRQEIGRLLDVDECLRFLAVNALLVNLDSFLAMGQNYYLYHEPGRDRFYWIPWDLDLAWGAWPMGGSPEQQADLSLLHPYAGQNRLIERLLKIPEHRAAYLARIRELAAGPFSLARLSAKLDAVRAAVRPAVAAEGEAALRAFDAATGSGISTAARPAPEAAGPGAPPAMPFMPLRSFFRQRVESVNAQLAGKRTGFVTQFGRPGAPGGPGEALGRPLFHTADRNGDGRLTPVELAETLAGWSREWDGDRSGALDPRELSRGLNRMFGFPPPGFPPGGAAGEGAPAVRDLAAVDGPGAALAFRLLPAVDTDRNGQASAAELSRAAAEWSRAWDRDRSGSLSPEEVFAGLGGLFGPPPGSGGRGGPP